jgi:hypothetical protein
VRLVAKEQVLQAAIFWRDRASSGVLSKLRIAFLTPKYQFRAASDDDAPIRMYIPE